MDTQSQQEDQLLLKRKLKHKGCRIIMNISGMIIQRQFIIQDTQYEIVKYVGKTLMKWKMSIDPNSNNWDLFWTDNAISQDFLMNMQSHQKVNHFPGIFVLSRKNYLAKNLTKLRRKFSTQFKFFPQTWILPYEYNELKNKNSTKAFIVKPEASCQGKGIFLTKQIESLKGAEHFIVQRYIDKPLLIDDLKFDIRLYVLLTGCDPLRIYLFKDGLARFATEKYQPPQPNNLDIRCMHLTNYAVNKENPNFVFNSSSEQMNVGHKRSFLSVIELLKNQGHNVDKLMEDIKTLIIKTFCSVQPILAHFYRSCQFDNLANNMCFQILGFDILIDYKMKPYLLEVNHTPSFTADTPLDSYIKSQLIRDTLKILNMSIANKNQEIQEKKNQMQLRVITGKKTKLSNEERKLLIDQIQKERDKIENARIGSFEKLYPLNEDQIQQYEPFITYASNLFEDSTGANIRRNMKKTETINIIHQNQKQLIQKIYNPYKNVKSKINTHQQFRISRTPISRHRIASSSQTLSPNQSPTKQSKTIPISLQEEASNRACSQKHLESLQAINYKLKLLKPDIKLTETITQLSLLQDSEIEDPNGSSPKLPMRNYKDIFNLNFINLDILPEQNLKNLPQNKLKNLQQSKHLKTGDTLKQSDILISRLSVETPKINLQQIGGFIKPKIFNANILMTPIKQCIQAVKGKQIKHKIKQQNS